MPTPVSYSITGNASGVVKSMGQVSSSTRQAASDVTSAATKIDRALDKAEASAKRLATAERSVANAAGSVRLAEAQLAAVRGRANATATQKIAAEERLYAANRRLAASEAEVASATAATQKASVASRIGGRATEIDKLGGALTKVGLVGAVALGATAKAAVDWESAWAGVTKTVNGTPEQLKAVEDGLRGLARTMPETATEIAAVAENAGQLGIKTGDIVSFTKTMVELGDTTNLTSEEAATSFGQLLNIMGDAPQTVGQLGDVLVKLGNNGASTERDILSLGTRLAGAGRQIGLTTPQVLAFSSAISSTGIEAEAGGTAMTQNFFAIDKAVRKGGASLDLYAKTAGLTSDQFVKAWGDDPASATAQFVAGLGRVQASGGSVRGVLDDLGIKSVRQADVYARLAGATKEAGNQADLLANSLKDAGNAQGALTNEAAVRYATNASKIRISLNKIKDDAISAGGALLPAVSGLTDQVGKAADSFAGLDSSTQKGLATTALVGTGLALAAGGALKLTTSVAGTINTLRDLGPMGGRAASGLLSLGKAAGVAVVALVAFEAAEAAASAVIERSDKSSHLATTLGDAGQAITAAGQGAEKAVPALDSFFQLTTTADLNPFTGKITGLNDAFKALDPQHGDKFFSALTHGLHVLGGPAGSLDLTRERFDQLDATLAQVSTTNAPAAAKAFSEIRAQSDTAGHSLDDLVNVQFGDYKKALQDQATAMGVTLPDSAQVYADWMGGKVPDAIKKAAAANPELAKTAGVAAAAVDEQKLSLQQLAAQAQASSDAIVAASNAEIAVQQALAQARQTASQNAGKGVNIKTAAGQANQSALNNIIGAQHQSVQQEAALPKPDFAAIVRGNEAVKKSYVDTAVKMGVESRKAKADADKNFKLPKAITSMVVVKTDKLSKAEVKDLNQELEKVPKEKRAEIVTIAQTKGAKAARNAIEQVKDKRVIARADGAPGGAKDVKKAMDALHDRLVKANSRGDRKGADAVADAMARLKNRTVTAKVNADISGALEARSAIATVHGKTVNVVINRVSKGDADGGPITHSYPRFDEGGRIRGVGGPRQDNIVGIDRRTGEQTSYVSVGEWVVDAKTTAQNSDNLQRMKDRPGQRWTMTPALADGGYPALAGGGITRLATGGIPSVNTYGVNLATIMQLITAISSPFRDLSKLAAEVKRQQDKIKKPTEAKVKAERAYDKAKDRQEDLRDRVNRLKKEADATKGVTKADRELKKARQQLAEANAKVSKTSRDKTEATKKYNDVAQPLKDATNALTEAQKALADSARQVAASFRDAYTSKSTDVRDWLQLMKDGTGDLTTFAARVAALRANGLSETLVQQVIGMGAVAGTDVANQIIAGGKGLVAQLNTTSQQLQTASDNLGLSAVGAPQRKALGGPVYGPGTGTSDSVLMRASRGEWVVPERSARIPANKAALSAMTYGRNIVDRSMVAAQRPVMPAPQVVVQSDGGYHDNSQVLVSGAGDPDRVAYRVTQRRRDSLARRGLTPGRRI